MSWGGNFRSNDINSAISSKKKKKKKEREKISSASCHTRHLSSMQHNRLPHWAFGSWSIELSAVLAKGAWSDDGANYCIHNVFLFFPPQSDSFWMRQWKESSFISLQNGVLFSLLIVASRIDHHRNRKYSQMLNHFWPVHITLRLSSKPPKELIF